MEQHVPELIRTQNWQELRAALTRLPLHPTRSETMKGEPTPRVGRNAESCSGGQDEGRVSDRLRCRYQQQAPAVIR